MKLTCEECGKDSDMCEVKYRSRYGQYLCYACFEMMVTEDPENDE